MVHLQGLEPWTHCIPLAVLGVKPRVYEKSSNTAERSSLSPRAVALSESVAARFVLKSAGAQNKKHKIFWCTSRDSNPGPTAYRFSGIWRLRGNTHSTRTKTHQLPQTYRTLANSESVACSLSTQLERRIK